MSPGGTDPAQGPGHWREYAMEAVLLGLFMVSACGFTVLLEYPASPAHRAIADPFLRRLVIGLAMGVTAVALIYSPWGKQSGAHMNPAFTVTFARLGKVAPRDAVGYVVAHFLGGVAGVAVAGVALPGLVSDPSVNFAVTVPGPRGVGVAFLAEAAMCFLLVLAVLVVSNHPRWASRTGLVVGTLLATYITFEAPLSGMSLNPARTVGSAFFAHEWRALWLYFTAPLLGMLAASEVYIRVRGANSVFCAKLHHQNPKRCIFCEFHREPFSAGMHYSPRQPDGSSAPLRLVKEIEG